MLIELVEGCGKIEVPEIHVTYVRFGPDTEKSARFTIPSNCLVPSISFIYDGPGNEEGCSY